jgi:hypothetical protein
MPMHLLVWTTALVALPTLAQPPSVSADPADARAVSPMWHYRSAFVDYRAWREPELTNWRSANNKAGAVGGHIGHVRGQAPETTMRGAVAAPTVKPEPSK